MNDLYDPIHTGGKVFHSQVWIEIVQDEYRKAREKNRVVYLSTIAERLVLEGRVVSAQDAQNIALLYAVRLRKMGRNWLTGERI